MTSDAGHFLSMRMSTIGFEETLELFRTRRVTQFAQCFRFDLADPFACDIELLAYFLERVVSVHFDAEAHPQYFRFARGQ